jgi:hypothetical protein
MKYRPIISYDVKRRVNTQIYTIRYEKGEHIKNTNDIQKIMREYFKNLYFKKLENSEEIDKLPAAFDLPKLDQQDINNLNESVRSNKIVSPQIKTQELLDLLLHSTRTLRKN